MAQDTQLKTEVARVKRIKIMKQQSSDSFLLIETFFLNYHRYENAENMSAQPISQNLTKTQDILIP